MAFKAEKRTEIPCKQWKLVHISYAHTLNSLKGGYIGFRF